MYVHTYVCTYICMYVCIYTNTHTHTYIIYSKMFQKEEDTHTNHCNFTSKSVNVFSVNLNHYGSHSERLVKVVEMCLVFTASAPVKQEQDVALW